MKRMKSQVLSARVPVDVMSAIDSICIQRGINRSQWLATTVVTQQSNDFFSEGGQIQARIIPKEIQEMLTAAGVAVGGILCYNLIGKALEKQVNTEGKPVFTQGEVELISIVTTVAIAMAGIGALKHFTKD